MTGRGIERGYFRRVASLFGWPIADQALSSLTNVWISVIAARSLSADDFGAFGVGMATYLFCQAVSRTWTTEPFGILLSHRSGSDRRDDLRGLCLTALLIGAGAAVAIATIDQIADGDLSGVVAVLALALPSLFLQDALRLSMLLEGEGRRSALNDSVWLTLVIIGPFVIDINSPASAMAVWAFGGVIGAALGLWQQRIIPVTGALNWLRRCRPLGTRLSLEVLTTLATGNLLVVIVGAAFGLAGAGAMRGVFVLFGPLAVVLGAVSIRSTPVVAQMARNSERLRRAVWRLSAGFAVLAAAQSAIILLLPADLGTKILGNTWSSAREIMPQYAVIWIATGIGGGPIVGLKSHGLVGRALATRVIGSVTTLTMIAVGFLVLELNLLLWVLAAGTTLAAAGWWISWVTSSVARLPTHNLGIQSYKRRYR